MGNNPLMRLLDEIEATKRRYEQTPPPTPSQGFMATLPASPVREYLGFLHALYVSQGASSDVLEAVEYTLRKIAAACPVPVQPWERGPQ